MNISFRQRAFNIVTKPAGPICNLNCRYCFYLEKEKLYPGERKWIMSDSILESYIQQYIEYQNGSTVDFIWQGGEPTLAGLAFYEKAVNLQKRYGNGKKITNAFQTNGILLNDKWCEFFVKNNFLIGISIDGPQHLHDSCRVTKGGQPSFNEVICGIELLKKHNVNFNTLTVVNRENSYYPLEVYRFLKEINSVYMQFIPAVFNNTKNITSGSYESDTSVTEWSVESAQYGNFLCDIFDEWVRNDVGKYFIQTFDVALENWCGILPGLCTFSETCGTALAIEHNGDIYSCDHYVSAENKLGNILNQQMNELVFSEKQVKFGNNKKEVLNDHCKSCDVRFACNGGCPKDRFISTTDGTTGLNYLCEGYKHFFSHITPYMQYMSNELMNYRPPANVMNWLKDKEQNGTIC